MRTFAIEAVTGTRGASLPHKAVIMIYLSGGPSHQDMYDLKMEAPLEIRGWFHPIATNVPGIEICEHMPRLAKMMDKVAIIRSLYGCPDQHASDLCLSGYPIAGSGPGSFCDGAVPPGSRPKGAENRVEGAATHGAAVHGCLADHRDAAAAGQLVQARRTARIAISGNRRKAAVYAALNVRTGTRCVDLAPRWHGDSFRAHLQHIRRQWRGWNIVLFLDRGTPHTAAASRQLAAKLGIELRWLPTACPELNPVEGLWRWLKGTILCNHQPDNFADTTSTAVEALEQLTATEALTLSGALSKNFWLRT